MQLHPEDMQIKSLATAETLPAQCYTNPGFLQTDVTKVLAQHWLYVTHESRLPKAGDYYSDVILQRPIVLVRQADMSIKAMANVCRHRAGSLVPQKAMGSGRMLRCSYHSWTYDLAGNLIGTPKFDGVENFAKKNCRLPEIHLLNYGGFLFVSFAEKRPEVEPYFGGIKERIAPLRLEDMKFYRRVDYEVKANWKVYVDNFLEGYHIGPVHPELAKILSLDGYVTEIEPKRILQYGPFASGDNPYGGEVGTNATYYWIYPNIMLNITPGRVQVNSILPIDHERTVTVFEFYYTETDAERLEQQAKDDMHISEIVQQQDVTICEDVWRGLISGFYEKGRFSVQEEAGVHAFHNMLRRDYGAKS